MTRQLDFSGQSGASYRYRPIEELKPVSPGGANYLFVRWDGDVAAVIYAGETDSLHRTVFENWDAAQSAHGATHIYARLNITGAVRRAEQADLIGKHRPPMNPAPAAAPRASKPAAAKTEAPEGEAKAPAKKTARKAG
ncbi:hypothetical protein [Caulobacter mirabilis]|uniref:Uncharacterized protein n=1 Tax=Caulobacter mirabilis TaxID=69666 RepID=A0A2D2AYI4_9CAUL|nr:hypothetical protein [Caulobacter mirabilis]ATQ43045.1 hypothetical protein CSW64_11800 [Caulobacter mirabilis]